MTFYKNMIKYNLQFLILILLQNIGCIMYIFKTYFSKYLYTYNITYVCTYIALNIYILINLKL
jgi:hypothetical protein